MTAGDGSYHAIEVQYPLALNTDTYQTVDRGVPVTQFLSSRGVPLLSSCPDPQSTLEVRDLTGSARAITESEGQNSKMGKGGEASDLGESSSAQRLVHEDARFSPFLADDFDVASFTSRVLAGSHITAQAQSEQLREGVRVLEAELATEVTGRSKDLIANVRRMGAAESSLQDVVMSVGSLQSALQRIRGESPPNNLSTGMHGDGGMHYAHTADRLL